MSFLQHTLISILLIFMNDNNASFINTIELPLMTTTIQPINETITSKIHNIENNLKNDEEQLKIDRQKLNEEKNEMQKYMENIDVIQLNVGGELIMATRETLTRVPNSILSIMFNSRWEHILQRDKNENIFLDFNPIIFRHLLDQLQLADIQNSLNTISLPSHPSLVIPFKKMMKKLGLDRLLSLEKNIIHFNVGGQMITNRRSTFSQISNSTFDSIFLSSQNTRFDNKSDVFLDYNPKLFQHLINQLRGESPKKQFYLKTLSSREKIIFQRMLIDLNISRQLILSTDININTKWKRNGITIAGGNNQGSELNQLSHPSGIYIDDDDQSIYIADITNDRIVQWKYGAKNGEVVAGGNGRGNQMNQLNYPTDVILDKKNDSIIICDRGNKRVIRWYRQNATNGEILISNIDCNYLAMDNNQDLYVSDKEKHEVRRWKIGAKEGTVVAGGSGKGNYSHELEWPIGIFVDEDHSVYVSDCSNHRVMKWTKGAKEGIVVAGGYGQGNNLTQLNEPVGVFVDSSSNVYMADSGNNRIMRWSPGSKEGSIVAGGNGVGQQSNQFSHVEGLSFDREGNLYVADNRNHRVQRFDIESN